MGTGNESADLRYAVARNAPPFDAASPPRSSISLKSYLDGLQAHVSYFNSAWVTAEVISSNAKGSVFYLELAESDTLGRRSASVNAKLWRNRDVVLTEFLQATGDYPRAGMRILVHLRPTFHPQYGLSLDIDRIDPSYTLGDIEQRLQRVRQKLKEAGLYDRNREYVCPDDFRRVAVISPDRAAALGDFREAADQLEAAGLCQFTYQTALFQGAGMTDSLISAMVAIVQEHKRSPFCALCIIRGGGSVADLAELNQYRLAHAVCCAPLPVLTGIGHERDNVLLDELASRRFDTPSKLVLHIERAIVRSAQSADADWQAIQATGQRVLDGARHDLDALYRTTFADAQRAIREARRTMQADMEQIVGMGPAHTLARGFAVVRDGAGRVVRSRQAAENATESLTIEFADGKLPVRKAGVDGE